MKNIEAIDRRRHPREITIAFLDRDIRLMREMLEIRLDNPADTQLMQAFNEDAIRHLLKTIPELEEMREQIFRDELAKEA